MKTFALIALSLIVGIGIGLAATRREFAHDQLPTATERKEVTDNNGAKLVIEGGTAYNFKEMDRHAEGEHEFIFRNEGTTPIGLKKGQTTCKCTMSEMKDGDLQPGESVPIKLTWTAKTGEADFSQSAEIITTNYPAMPVVRLHVYGKIIDALRTDRGGNLSLGTISTSEPIVGRFKVHAFRGDEPLQIVKHEFLTAEHADAYSATFRPLTPEEVAAEPNAKSGVEATVHIKSGLPLGSLSQALRLSTNLPNTAPLTVAIEGRIVGDIMLVGPGVVSDQNMIRLGDTQSSVGKKAQFHVLVKGPHRAETTLKLADVAPAGELQAVLGEALTDNPQVTRYPLTITVPVGAKPVVNQGTVPGEAGIVRLTTTHPQIPEFVIIVRYAVRE
ncbi:DUF1573 domain-containing protein [Anatilimnocola floriformis]|uniref:DUF1573 domain-containing protein n=1 Tax=Anatilimnocola floriformis TaxID=2948575 RepID=UPI0020C3FFD8|nr:DUF1573 domain-containing protein [Anatilimnocola floriformis]